MNHYIHATQTLLALLVLGSVAVAQPASTGVSDPLGKYTSLVRCPGALKIRGTPWSFAVSSATECASLCDGIATCTTFTWDGTHCFPKAGCEGGALQLGACKASKCFLAKGVRILKYSTLVACDSPKYLNGYHNIPVVSLDECATLCDNHEQCTTFFAQTATTGGLKCNLKAGCSGSVRTTGVCPNPNRCFHGKHFEIEKYSTIESCNSPRGIKGKTKVYKVASANECAALCDAEPKCSTFKSWSAGRKCKLRGECRVGGRTLEVCTNHKGCKSKYQGKNLGAVDKYSQMTDCDGPQALPTNEAPIAVASSTAPEDCAALCDSADGCTTFRTRAAKCWLLSGCAGERVAGKHGKGTLRFMGKDFPKPKPNLIFVLADDQGFANVGFRNDAVITPNMDRLAKEGVVLDRHYTAAWCAPTRVSLMTGRMPLRVSHKTPNPALEFLPAVLKRAGYTSHHVGKWHIGNYAVDNQPETKGFDTTVGNPGQSPVIMLPSLLEKIGEDATKVVYVDETGANLYLKGLKPHCSHKYVDFRQSPSGQITNFSATKPCSSFMYAKYVHELVYAHDVKKPIFLYINPTQAHTPLAALDEHRQPYLDAGRADEFATYNGMITAVDGLLGTVVAAFKARKMWGNTLLVYSSDNGGLVCSRRGGSVPGYASNHPLRGSKKTALEGGIRTVAFMAGGILPQSTTKKSTLTGLLHISDWYTTFAGLAGVPQVSEPLAYIEAGVPTVDGIDMWPYLTGEVTESPRSETYFDEGFGTSAIIQWPYKYLRSANGHITLFGYGCAGYSGKLDTGMPSNTKSRASADKECDTERVIPLDLDVELDFYREAVEDEGLDFTDDDADSVQRALGFCPGSEDLDCSAGCLFDIEKDPSESINLIGSLSDKATELDNLLRNTIASTKEKLATAVNTAPGKLGDKCPIANEKNGVWDGSHFLKLGLTDITQYLEWKVTPTVAASVASARHAPVPTEARKSKKTCEELGWPVKPATPSVCGASELIAGSKKARCYGAEKWTWQRAFLVCDDAGGRLCTEGEIVADVVQGTGCNLDQQNIWSVEECAHGHVRMPSRLSLMLPHLVECDHDDGGASIRCCADSESGGAVEAI